MKSSKLDKKTFAGAVTLSRSEMKLVMGGTVSPEVVIDDSGDGCNSVGTMCESHSDCCQPRGGTTLCMLSLSSGYGYCTAWN